MDIKICAESLRRPLLGGTEELEQSEEGATEKRSLASQGMCGFIKVSTQQTMAEPVLKTPHL